jgi:hypothetical protein
MSTLSAQEMIRDALLRAEMAEPGLQPSILMHRNLDHDKVAEYTGCHVSDQWEDTLTGLVSSGWIVFRIQTEFGVAGHYTMAYLAKMKAN